MDKKVTQPAFDLESLNIVKDCEQIFTFPFLNADGEETGITVSVVGKHCNMVKSHIDRLLNKRRQADKLAERSGKNKARPVQEDEQLGLEMVAIRVVSWTGITQECSFENVMRLCEINPLFVEQVSLHSEELSNFTQSK
jgi:hypothetical protein